MGEAIRWAQAETTPSRLILERLNGLRERLRAQLKGLESGEVKVLRLLDGGSTDEDDTREHVEQLQLCISEIDLILLESARATSLSSLGAVRRIDAIDLAAAVG
jgi:hypothetical protein